MNTPKSNDCRPASIEVDGLEYQCWHELGHAITCLHFGGDVEFVELLDDEVLGGRARARCSTTPDIRQSVACGGFAMEFVLLRKGRLGNVDEREIAQTLFRNAGKDRNMFHGRPVDYDDNFTKDEDQAFMTHAIDKVVPILPSYLTRMAIAVNELLKTKRIEGLRLKAILLSQE